MVTHLPLSRFKTHNPRLLAWYVPLPCVNILSYLMDMSADTMPIRALISCFLIMSILEKKNQYTYLYLSKLAYLTDKPQDTVALLFQCTLPNCFINLKWDEKIWTVAPIWAHLGTCGIREKSPTDKSPIGEKPHTFWRPWRQAPHHFCKPWRKALH